IPVSSRSWRWSMSGSTARAGSTSPSATGSGSSCAAKARPSGMRAAKPISMASPGCISSMSATDAARSGKPWRSRRPSLPTPRRRPTRTSPGVSPASTSAMRGFPKRYKIIARRGGYHGSTMGAMSVTSSRNEKFFGPFMYGVSFVPSPNRYRNDFGLEGEAGDLACANAVEQELLAQGPDTVAAVLGEPVSTANNCHVPSPRYWQRVREICDKHGVLLILDEVINGFGRTGTMFATEQFGVVPDLMTMAKGLSSGYAPIAAVAVSERLYDEFKKQDVALAHLLTFGGQAVSCAAALKNIEILQREELPQKSARHGRYLLGKLEALRAHPTVGDVRGLGLMCAVELVKDKATKEPFGWGPAAAAHPFSRRVAELMEERGLLTRVFMSVQLSPPLVITTDEIDRMVAIVDESLTVAEKELGFR